MGVDVSIMEIAFALSLIAALLLSARLHAKARRMHNISLSLIDSLDFGIIAMTSRSHLVICNRLVAETLGLQAKDGGHLYDVASNPLLNAICTDIDNAQADAIKPFDIIDQNGRYRRWERAVVTYQDAGKPLAVALLRDRSEVQELTLRLEKSSSMDTLTGLATRDIFLDRLTQALEIAQRSGTLTGILMIEIDGFTQIVDRQGWEQARQIVADVAMRIASTTRASDTIARIGHNEFAVLLTNLPGAATAQHTARRFLESVRIPALSAGNETFPPIPITGSIGIALAPRDGSTALHLLKSATMACQRAARMGGAQMAAYEAKLDEEPSPASSFTRDMRLGLEKKQFFLEYQPVVALGERLPLYFEALLRWQHPERGLMPVGDFVTAAEQSGVIHDLGNFVVRTSIADALLSPGGLPLSINVSVVELMSGEWPRQMAAQLRSAGLAPEQVMVEITHAADIANLGKLRPPIDELHQLGIKVLLDDFGTGRSSLSELDTLHFDGIKIDRQLIHDLNDPRSREMVQMLIDYCAVRDATAIAVGVETEAQAAQLIEMGCLCGQGYLFGRPAPWPQPVDLGESPQLNREAAR